MASILRGFKREKNASRVVCALAVQDSVRELVTFGFIDMGARGISKLLLTAAHKDGCGEMLFTKISYCLAS